MQNLTVNEIESVAGGMNLQGVIPLNWSLPAGEGGSDVQLWGVGYDWGGGVFGAGMSDDKSVFGLYATFAF